MPYDKFRVKSPVKTFRDLEVYPHTNNDNRYLALCAFVIIGVGVKMRIINLKRAWSRVWGKDGR